MKKFIKTKLALARELEISRPSLDTFLNTKGAPEFIRGKGYDLAATVDFIAEHSDGAHQGAHDGNTLRAAKLREINLRCQRLQFRNDAEMGKYVLASDVATAIHKIGGGMRSRLDARLVQQLPVLVAGLNDIPSVRIVCRNVFNQCVDDIAELAALLPDETQIEPKPEPPAAD